MKNIRTLACCLAYSHTFPDSVLLYRTRMALSCYIRFSSVYTVGTQALTSILTLRCRRKRHTSVQTFPFRQLLPGDCFGRAARSGDSGVKGCGTGVEVGPTTVDNATDPSIVVAQETIVDRASLGKVCQLRFGRFLDHKW